MLVPIHLHFVAILDAVSRRKEALEELRKARELGGEISSEAVDQAISEYQNACDDDERLRTILPGVRLAEPFSLADSGETTARGNNAAEQFPVESVEEQNDSQRILPP